MIINLIKSSYICLENYILIINSNDSWMKDFDTYILGI